jgi:cell division inhibitor SepF
MAMWKKAMDYLGLGPDDAYDDYDPSVEQERPRQRTVRDTGSHRAIRAADDPDDAVRTMPTRPSFPTREQDPMGRRDDSTVNPRPLNQPPRQASATRVIPSAGEPYTVKPKRFDSAQELADKFKEGQPVIMNLEGADREVSRRLIDFASGLCYALNGSMEKVATGVYLLKPLPRGYDA